METLWEKLLFWKKQKMLKEGVDYHFFDFKDSDITGIELLMKEYKGVIYHYQKARVLEEGEFARLQFGYTIVHSGEHDIDDLTTDDNLHTIMGDILTTILANQANEQTRTDNNQEFDIQ
jgi:hypothetical protein